MRSLIVCAVTTVAWLAVPSSAYAACEGHAAGAAKEGEANAVSKDGQRAPLELNAGTPGVTESAGGTTMNMAEAQAGGAASANSGEISKDGRTMPLAEGSGQADTSVAMSDQDVAAQQEGKPTAAQASNTEACR